jgi:hypothetical protein
LQTDGLFDEGGCQGARGTDEYLKGPVTSRPAFIVSQVQRENTTSPRNFSE